MQPLFHKNPNPQYVANGHSCMVRIHTKPEYQMMTPDTPYGVNSMDLITLTHGQRLAKGDVTGFYTNRYIKCVINLFLDLFVFSTNRPIRHHIIRIDS
jgi:hypothetical protein